MPPSIMSLEAEGCLQLKSDFSCQETLSAQEISGHDGNFRNLWPIFRYAREQDNLVDCRWTIIGSLAGYLSAGSGKQRFTVQ